MILTKHFWIILISIALIIIFTLICKNKVIIKPPKAIAINTSSAEVYNDANYYDGETTYQRYCASCHGNLEIEKNGTGIAPPLNEYGNVWKLSSNNIAKKVLFGSLTDKTSKMPAFSGMLSHEKVKNIITYIIYGLPQPYIIQRHKSLNINIPKNSTLTPTNKTTDDSAQEQDSSQPPTTTTKTEDKTIHKKVTHGKYHPRVKNTSSIQ